MTALPVLNMFKPTQTYEPVGAEEPQAELAGWREDPDTTVEARNHQINIHRRPGFYKKGLLGSIAINAILMIVCAWMYMKLTMSVPKQGLCKIQHGDLTDFTQYRIEMQLKQSPIPQDPNKIVAPLVQELSILKAWNRTKGLKVATYNFEAWKELNYQRTTILRLSSKKSGGRIYCPS
ncbi:hypothetical protein ABVK25_004892 [Lepraria finkii]|uniref:Uncharacterized protein n=1 Tax=Lepraria finkii TaxID=1340010 RepID=A0ABR4B9T9_9LECA